MLIRDWVESVTIQSSKDQHKHTAAFRLNNAFQSIARDHLWSWLTEQFHFTTVPTVDMDTATYIYNGFGGLNYIDVAGGAFQIDRRWTGAEILIQENTAGLGPTIPLHMRVTSVRKLGYTDTRVYLDRELPETFTSAKIKLFRREYLPRSSAPVQWTADRLIGKIRFRDMVNALRSTTRPTLQYLTRVDYQHNYGHAVESGSQVPQYFQMMASRRIPAPVFGPDVTGVVAGLGPLPQVGGTYYLACAYLDRDSHMISPLGPITTYENPNVAAGSGITVEYGNTTGVPEQSYDLVLFVSKSNPVGLDGREINKQSRVNERMIPFFTVSDHPFDAATFGAGTKGAGQWEDFQLSENVPTYDRYYPQADAQMVFLRELPNAAIPFVVDGKLKMPWFCDLFDSPPIPDNFQDIVNTIVSIGINESAGGADIQKRGQYEFMLRKLRGRDLKRSRSGEVDPRHRGDVIPRVDRYGLLD